MYVYCIFINLKKKKIMDTGVLVYFNKNLILDYYFCLKSGPVFLFQIFMIAHKIISPKVLVTKGIYSRRFNFRDKWDRRGRMVQNVDEFKISIRARCTTLCDKVCHWLATGRWFSPNPPVSPTNKTDRHDITKLLLKVALNIITLAVTQRIWNSMHNS
jgi:hypothetical protein